MQYKYKKIVFLFLIIVTISIAILFVISKQKGETTEVIVQNSQVVSHVTKEEIYTTEDYIRFIENVNSGNNYEGCEVSLQADLDFSDYKNVDSIGIAGEEGIPFLGTFNGNGHTITGMIINDPTGYVGMFSNLGGIVKNLLIENSFFSGHVCGAVAADTTNAAVINCYVDAVVQGETAGIIVGKLDGNLENCVASKESFAGEIKSGKIEYCYQKDLANFEELINNLVDISGYYKDADFCCWENERLSTKKADLLKNLTARLNVGGVELKLSGYYSPNSKKWNIVLPASYGKEAIGLEAKTSLGGYQSFSRNPEEETMIFTWDNQYYPIDFLCADNIETAYVTLQKQKNLDYVHKNKLEEIPGILTMIGTDGKTSYAQIKGFYGHGNDSWEADKKSYNLKLESYVDLLNMGTNDDYVFLAGYRDNSLMSYVATTELVQELGFAYAPEFRLVNLYVAGEYAGVYFLTEKIEIDKNRIEIDSVYENSKIASTARLDSFDYCSWKDEKGKAERYYYNVEENPKDITGGYLLETDVADYADDDSRFVSDRTLKMTLKRARYSSKEQMDYIADYWQEFEDALFDEDGYNSLGKHYSSYIDMESFAMQWLIYELVQEGSVSSSIYYYKESDVTGDGLLHACFPWDMEHSYLMHELSEELWLADDGAYRGYWNALYVHEDFQAELYRVWREKFVPAIQKILAEDPKEYDSGLRTLSWYQENIVGLHQLENSRWKEMYPWNRIGEIKEFLSFRLEALSDRLAK